MANISKVGTRINIGNASTLFESEASLVALANGKLGIVFTGEVDVGGTSLSNIYFQSVSTAGTRDAVQLVVTRDAGVDSVSRPEAAVLSDGTLGVVFREDGSGITNAAYINFDTTSGAQSSYAFLTQITPGINPDIAMLPGNGAVFSIHSPFGAGVLSFQSTIGGSFVVSSNRSGGSENSIARLDNGRYVASGHGPGTLPEGGAFVSIFNSAGTELTPFLSTIPFYGPLPPRSSDYSEPDVHALTSGGLGHFLSSWSDSNVEAGSLAYGFTIVDDSGEIFAEVFGYVWADLALGEIVQGDVARLPNGGFVISYMDEALNTYVQAFDAIGRSYGAAVKINAQPGQQVYAPSLQTIGSDIFIAYAEGATGGMALQKLDLNERAAPIYGSTAVDMLNGTASANIIFGDNGSDKINGLGGNDSIFGGAGNDVISDGTGNDILHGWNGNDRFIAGTGTDAFDGGEGIDTLDYRQSTEAAEVVIGGFPDGLDSASGIEVVLGSNFNDRILQFDFGYGLQQIYGYSGDDEIVGGADFQIINGGDGNDTIFGGGQRDILEGGAGKDVFAYQFETESLVTDCDRIFDFEATATDSIDLHFIDAVAGGSNNAFTFLAAENSAFTGLGQIRWYQAGTSTWIEGNTTGDNNPDFKIELVGIMDLNRADFIL